MKTMQKLIYMGFATCALASASMPAFSWTVWPDVDFEWYANVGKPVAGSTVEVHPAPRPGYIWAPGHYEWNGTRHVWMPGVWVKDDYDRQWKAYAFNNGRTTYANGPLELRDRDGNVIPINPEAYPIDSTRR